MKYVGWEIKENFKGTLVKKGENAMVVNGDKYFMLFKNGFTPAPNAISYNGELGIAKYSLKRSGGMGNGKVVVNLNGVEIPEGAEIEVLTRR